MFAARAVQVPVSAERIAVMARNWKGAPVAPYQASLVIPISACAPSFDMRRTWSGKSSS